MAGWKTEQGVWDLTDVLALVDATREESLQEGYEQGYEAGREEAAAFRWWEVVMCLSCALAFLACAAFWLAWWLL